MPLVRAMAVLQGASGIAKDRYINTWTFDTTVSTITPDVATNIGDALDQFYAFVDPFIPDSITRLDYRLYDLEDVLPREPTLVAPTTQPASVMAPYPYEVAAVMSFYGLRNLPRERGRVYLGPLTTQAGTPGEINADPQLSLAFRTAVLDGAEALHQGVRTAGGDGAGSWCMLSSVSGQRTIIENAWVDNAFDTQRRRGSQPTARTVRSFESLP